ncbi:MAG TPA: hypothetical protein PKH10_07590 [bacterium]|nr:hypothetical protein [bacterium]
MSIVIDDIKKMAALVGSLSRPAVFVGGAVAVLYTDRPEFSEMRATKDIDLVFKIASLTQLETVREELVRAGFSHVIGSPVVCRFAFERILVDVMALDAVGWAPGNHWFKRGFNRATPYSLDGAALSLLPFPYYLASKFDAFLGRGMRDAYASHDLEDIVFVLDGRKNFAQELIGYDDREVISFLRTNMEKLMTDERLKEAVLGHLPFRFQEERFKRLQQSIALFCDVGNGG